MLHLHSNCGNNTNVTAHTEDKQNLMCSCSSQWSDYDYLLQAVNSVYINSHEVIMKLVYFLKAQLSWSQFET